MTGNARDTGGGRTARPGIGKARTDPAGE